MGKIVTKAVNRTYKTLIKQVVRDLGEAISLYYDPDVIRCPNCLPSLDTGKSKGIFDASFVSPFVFFGETINPAPFSRGRCPVCKGEGSLYHYTPVVIQALVKWQPEDAEMVRTVAGDEGSNIVRVKARKSSYIKIRDCKYSIIDGVKCQLVRPPIFRGLGKADELVLAYFQAVEVGKSVKG